MPDLSFVDQRKLQKAVRSNTAKSKAGGLSFVELRALQKETRANIKKLKAGRGPAEAAYAKELDQLVAGDFIDLDYSAFRAIVVRVGKQLEAANAPINTLAGPVTQYVKKHVPEGVAA